MTNIEVSQALNIIDKVLKPNKLSTLQEFVIRQCWLGKTYQDIALESGYNPDYIRVLGSRLWQKLSLAFEEKVTKNNFPSVLRQQLKMGEFFNGVYSDISTNVLEIPDGQVALTSNFYIERPPYEALTCEEILYPGALVVIKSPLNMGKTSLMVRILAHTRSHNYSQVVLNLNLAEGQILSNLERLLRWLMANITLQLGMKSELNQYWDRDLGIKVSCTNYLQGYILGQLPEPLVLALDEVNHLFEYPAVAQEFLSLLRFWHEEANNHSIWQRLRLIVVHSTSFFIPLDINQSPFNSGLPITLPEFNFGQIKDLARRHQFKLEVENLDQSLASLMAMIGGYPYLARKAFYALSTQKITFKQLLEEAPTLSGIYRSHLQGHLVTLKHYPELARAYRLIVSTDSPVSIPSIPAYKLESVGLTKLVKNRLVPSCQLYRLYFRNYLEV